MPSLFGVEVSEDVYAANAHLVAQPKETQTPARKALDAELKHQFARQFEATWRLLGGPELEPEFPICTHRNWRADYRIGNLLIELDGGVWSKGRHTRGGGYIEDCVKLNTATLLGYRVIRIATGMATAQYLEQIIKAISPCGQLIP